MEFVDRLLKCSDCTSDFVFTAGEQLFFFDKQFKNDPKRCKLCKAKRASLGRPAATGEAAAVSALPLSRTETRTECSACGIETTVPFKPTQGRPVLCRGCFQVKRVAVTAAAFQSAATSAALSPTVDARLLPSLDTAAVLAQAPPSMIAEGAAAAHVDHFAMEA